MSAAAKANVVVTVDDNYLNRFGEVAQRCQAAGLHIQQQLSNSGLLTGDIAPEQIDQLAQLEGVASIEQTRSYQLPPPDSPIQ